MLPCVDNYQRLQVSGKLLVVRRRVQLKLPGLYVERTEGPAGTFDSARDTVELSFETLYRAERSHDESHEQRTWVRWSTAALRRRLQILPEVDMVVQTAAIELDVICQTRVGCEIASS